MTSFHQSGKKKKLCSPFDAASVDIGRSTKDPAPGKSTANILNPMVYFIFSALRRSRAENANA